MFVAANRRELKPFASFEVHTHVAGWDEQHLYMEQRVVKDNFIHAVVMAKMRLLNISGDQLLAAAGYRGSSPPLEEEIKSWSEYDRLSSERMRPGSSGVSRKVD